MENFHLIAIYIYVLFYNLFDNIYEIACSTGVHVWHEPDQGKGGVVRRMFREIEADYYLMVDGNDTYDDSIALHMINLAINEKLDLVNSRRKETESNAYRSGHRFGNLFLTGAVCIIFGNRIYDMFSGYKVFQNDL